MNNTHPLPCLLPAFIVLLLAHATLGAQELSWRPIGPHGGSVSSIFSSIGMDSGGIDAVGTLYVSTDEALFLNADEGETWSATGSRNIWSLLPIDGELLGSRPITGAVRSTDAGSIWRPSNLGLHGPVIGSIAVVEDTTLFASGETLQSRLSAAIGEWINRVAIPGEAVPGVRAQKAPNFTGYVELGGAGAGASVDVEWRFWRRVSVRMGAAYMPRFLLTGTTAVGPIVGMGVESADWGDCAQVGIGLMRVYETSDPLNLHRDRNDFLYASIGYRYLQMDGSLMLSLSLTPLFPLKLVHGQWPIYPWLGAGIGWRW